MKRECRNCLYWDHIRYHTHDNMGECRRHAPAPMYSFTNGNDESVKPAPIWWPRTLGTFWCGDFAEIMRPKYEGALAISSNELLVSTRTATVLKEENMLAVGDVVARSEEEWLRCPNFGRKSLNDLKEALSLYNLKLKPKE